MSGGALGDEIRAAIRDALREELPAILAELRSVPRKDGERLLGIKDAAMRLGSRSRPPTRRGATAVAAVPARRMKRHSVHLLRRSIGYDYGQGGTHHDQKPRHTEEACV